MHARELVDLACVLSARGPLLIRQTQPLACLALEEYWVASKCRLDRWMQRLRHFDQAAADAPRPAPAGVRAVIEEILTGEVLTRVWAAVACAHDGLHGLDDAEPIARSVLVGHLEARHRVLMLLVSGRQLEADEALRLDRLRRRVERWTDMLLGYLGEFHDVGEFAFEPNRAAEFARDLRTQGELRGGRSAWPLVQASLRAAFGQGLCPWSPNTDLNARIAAGILSCFPPEMFDSTGLPRSLWSLRLTQAASDAQGMIGQLLALDREPAATRTFLRARRSGS